MRDACDLLRVSRRTVARLVELHELHARKDNDKPHAGHLEISLDSVNAYLTKCASSPAQHVDDEAFPKLWTLREVHERTGFALRTLERDCRAGRIAHIHRGRKRFMTTAQVEMLVTAHAVKNQPALPDSAKLAAQEKLRKMMERAGKR